MTYICITQPNSVEMRSCATYQSHEALRKYTHTQTQCQTASWLFRLTNKQCTHRESRWLTVLAAVCMLAFSSCDVRRSISFCFSHRSASTSALLSTAVFTWACTTFCLCLSSAFIFINLSCCSWSWKTKRKHVECQATLHKIIKTRCHMFHNRFQTTQCNLWGTYCWVRPHRWDVFFSFACLSQV